MLKTNYHTHTIFCDGNNSTDEIAEEAVKKGFDILGFSSHAMFPFSSSWHINPKNYNSYVESVLKTKEKYQDKIKILLGFEADYAFPVSKPAFDIYKKFNPDFLIGSVHYIFTERGRLAVDYGAEKLQECIKKLFNGDTKKLVCEYFYQEREMLKKSDFSILGHCDLIRKNNKILNMYNENDFWYRKEIKATADQIKKSGIIVEVNTGAIARGYMEDVYPSQEFLSLLKERNIPVTISSDAHKKEDLDFAFDKALEQIKKASYSELAYIDIDRKVKFQKI